MSGIWPPEIGTSSEWTESWSGVRERLFPASGACRPGGPPFTRGSAPTRASVREGGRVPGGRRDSHGHEVRGIGRT